MLLKSIIISALQQGFLNKFLFFYFYSIFCKFYIFFQHFYANIVATFPNCCDCGCAASYKTVENDFLGIGKQPDDSGGQLDRKFRLMVIITSYGWNIPYPSRPPMFPFFWRKSLSVEFGDAWFPEEIEIFKLIH